MPNQIPATIVEVGLNFNGIFFLWSYIIFSAVLCVISCFPLNEIRTVTDHRRHE